MNLQTGAFGDPASTETLILFWSKMEELHYPGAGTTKKYLEDKLEREQQQAAQMQQMQMQMMQQQQMQQMAQTAPGGPQGGPQVPEGLAQAIEQKARQDAEAAARGQ